MRPKFSRLNRFCSTTLSLYLYNYYSESVTSASAIHWDAVETKPVYTDIIFPTETQESNSTRVKVNNISLTNNDEDLLVHGEKLLDKHINLA